jgi:hypothetical protein
MQSSKAMQNKLSAFLPSPDDFMSLSQYSQLYNNMMKAQTDEKGNDLPQKEKIEEEHHVLRKTIVQQKLKSMQLSRKKK